MKHIPRKRFGQNFLTDDVVLHDIISSIAPAADDAMVEIGPGLAAMTALLLEQLRHLHVVELDRDLVGLRPDQKALRNELEALPKLPGAPALAEWLPSSAPGLDALCQRAPNQQLETLRCFLQHLDNASARLSDEIGLHYFNHNPSWHPDNPPARNSPC